MPERGPKRRFDLDKKHYAEIVVGEPIERGLGSIIPGEVTVHRRTDGKKLTSIPHTDVQFAIFGINNNDPEIEDLKTIIAQKMNPPKRGH